MAKMIGGPLDGTHRAVENNPPRFSVVECDTPLVYEPSAELDQVGLGYIVLHYRRNRDWDYEFEG